MLSIDNIFASINEKEILKGLTLNVKCGEIHAIMGTNGSGKSTLAKVLTGHPSYFVTKGKIRFEGQDISDLAPEERSQLGIFLAFQYPVEIPGVSNEEFLRIAYNLKRKNQNLNELNPIEFFDLVNSKLGISTISGDLNSQLTSASSDGSLSAAISARSANSSALASVSVTGVSVSTQAPTAAPSPSPSSAPTTTFAPTGVPTVSTVPPTSLPTPKPSTPFPTPRPTFVPIPVPTRVPIPVPTPMPTDAGCTDGRKSGDETDVDCGGRRVGVIGEMSFVSELRAYVHARARIWGRLCV